MSIPREAAEGIAHGRPEDTGAGLGLWDGGGSQNAKVGTQLAGGAAGTGQWLG